MKKPLGNLASDFTMYRGYGIQKHSTLPEFFLVSKNGDNIGTANSRIEAQSLVDDILGFDPGVCPEGC